LGGKERGRRREREEKREGGEERRRRREREGKRETKFDFAALIRLLHLAALGKCVAPASRERESAREQARESARARERESEREREREK